MNSKVSDLIAQFLAKNEIRHVFGIIGSGNAHIFDSVTRLGYTEIVCVHHEQAAIMAMGIYYRTCGKVSAALLTTGAGSTNGVTGIVSCWMDSVPGLIISGNENSKFTTPENELRIWGVQGYDSVEMVRKVTKYAQRVMEPKDIHYELAHAYETAKTGRPGPVWLDVPMNIQSATVETGDLKPVVPVEVPSFKSTPRVASLATAVDQVSELLAQAKRPLIWLGHGIRYAEATQLVKPLLETLGAPALVTWNGIDLIESDHPLVFGRAGLYGQRASNFILQNCDFLLTIGTRLAVPQVGYDLTEFARAAKIACVDIDLKEVSKHGDRIALPICADAKAFMTALLEKLKTRPPVNYEPWLARCRSYFEKFPSIGPEHADQGGYINSYPFMEKLSHVMKDDQIVVTDMGTALLSGHQVIRLKKNQRMMTSTGLGEMGFGLPAAIGASFARNRGEVICLNCDGGMMMNLQELQTIAHHHLPIKTFIFNNDGYLMIKHTQKALFEGRYSGTNVKSGVSCPDYAKLGKAFDFPVFQIRTWADFDMVMPKVLEASGPVFCEVFMHPEQLLVPKLGLSLQKDGSIISPPLEDLSPFLPREQVREAMIIGMHPKSEKINS
jgi:acetolactate synthase-1/2/3 large subunit